MTVNLGTAVARGQLGILPQTYSRYHIRPVRPVLTACRSNSGNGQQRDPGRVNASVPMCVILEVSHRTAPILEFIQPSGFANVMKCPVRAKLAVVLKCRNSKLMNHLQLCLSNFIFWAVPFVRCWCVTQYLFSPRLLCIMKGQTCKVFFRQL